MSNEPQTTPNPADLRTSTRAPIKLRVDSERMNSYFADYTKNISKGGTFIKTGRPLPLGTRFTFALSVPALSEAVSLVGGPALAPLGSRVRRTAPMAFRPGH